MPEKPKRKKKADEPKKRPHEMTTDEALEHLFHPKVVKEVKGAIPAPEDEDSVDSNDP
jgi:hypothetical protein